MAVAADAIRKFRQIIKWLRARPSSRENRQAHLGDNQRLPFGNMPCHLAPAAAAASRQADQDQMSHGSSLRGSPSPSRTEPAADGGIHQFRFGSRLSPVRAAGPKARRQM